MVSADTLLSYTYWSIPLTVHTTVSDKQLGAVISKNNKPIAILSIRLRDKQHKFTTTKKV